MTDTESVTAVPAAAPTAAAATTAAAAPTAPTATAPTPAPSLLPLDFEVGRVLAVVAHPDDLEFGAAAAVAAWTDAGHEVVYLLVTRGEAGIDSMSPAQAGAVREAEERDSAAIVGVHTVEFLDYPDGVIEYGVPLRRDIAAAIRRHRPDTLLLFNHRENWGPGRMNSPDHRNVGTAALDAVGDAGNRWIFPELAEERHAVRNALVTGSPHSTHAMDVTATVDRAVASLAAHSAYLKGLGEHPMADPEVIRMFLEGTGQRFQGAGAALAFELFSF
jgi:LmbE family N-acetylglucosaminyl deacetylase